MEATRLDHPSGKRGTNDADLFDASELDVLAGAMSFFVRSVNLSVSRYLETHLAGTPLSGGTGKVTTLFMVQKRPGITAAEVAPYAGKDAPAMARLVDRLIASGLIDRRPDPRSRRRQLLFITPKGEAHLDLVRDIVSRERREAFGMLSDEEHEQAVRLLRKVAGAYLRKPNGKVVPGAGAAWTGK